MDEVVDLDIIRLGIQQFINQGIKKPIVSKEANGAIEFKGEKDLQTYTDRFEKYLLDETVKFFRVQGNIWYNSLGCN